MNRRSTSHYVIPALLLLSAVLTFISQSPSSAEVGNRSTTSTTLGTHPEAPPKTPVFDLRASSVISTSQRLKLGTQVQISSLISVAFRSPNRGYGLATISSATVPVATTNGGKTWTVVGPVLYSPNMDSDDAVSTLSISAAGILIASGGTNGIDAADTTNIVVDTSTDGGREWLRTTFPGNVTVSGDASDLWAIVTVAWPQTVYPAFYSGPTGWLYTSSNGGASWNYRSTLPAKIGPYEQLVVTSQTDALALSPGENNTYAGRYGGLAITTNGGKTWRSVTHPPCSIDAAPRFGDNEELGGSSDQDLWIICGDDVPVANWRVPHIAMVDRSTDGGSTWTQVAGTRELALYPHGPNFPSSSGVPNVLSVGVAGFTPSDVWLILDEPNTLWRTTDDGSTWNLGAPKQIQAQAPQQVFALGDDVLVRTHTAIWLLSNGKWSSISS